MDYKASGTVTWAGSAGLGWMYVLTPTLYPTLTLYHAFFTRSHTCYHTHSYAHSHFTSASFLLALSLVLHDRGIKWFHIARTRVKKRRQYSRNPSINVVTLCLQCFNATVGGKFGNIALFCHEHLRQSRMLTVDRTYPAVTAHLLCKAEQV